ncbi:MAG TPA: TetR family transcriptional regulator [Bryobacteraceae bacterium]|jgi:AcrR family transcriptional regulator|nr:TetR family transcriptional regulator [Bryobacteraceae bacterium]
MIERSDTKTRILDAAEKLFGEKGFDGTSLREITTEADVNLAAVNYHFQSKDSLIEAVILRAAGPANGRRLAMLEAAGPKATVEQIVEAFVSPVLEYDYHSIAPLMARVLSSPEIMQRVFKQHIETLSRRFADAIAVALPELSAAERMWRLHFTAGAMAHTVTRAPLMRDLFGGVLDINDRQLLIARLVRFAAAGFRAPEGY